MGAAMRFRVKIALLALAFVTALLCDEAIAQTYFTVAKSGITSITTQVMGTCQDYNNQSASGVDVNHPDYCQFSSTQINFNGWPFDQYWQAVSIGAVPPPFKVKYTRGTRYEQCGTLGKIEELPRGQTAPIEVSMHIPTSRLDWSARAASVGPACRAEWIRHTSVTLASDTANFKTAVNIVQQLVSTLNTRIPKKYKSCASIATPEGGSVQKQILASFVAMFKNAISNDVKNAETSWSPQGVSGQACRLHCNVCSSGWAGTITLKKTFTATGQNYFNETDTYYVGGTSSTTNYISAEWTAVGSGKYDYDNTATSTHTHLNWTLNADAPVGQCGMTNVACFRAVPDTQTNKLQFIQQNSQITLNNGIQWTYNGQSQQPAQAKEIQIYPALTTTPATATTANGTQHGTSCSVTPPQPGITTYTCTQDWAWELYKQP
jgi:hypothetical protein